MPFKQVRYYNKSFKFVIVTKPKLWKPSISPCVSLSTSLYVQPLLLLCFHAATFPCLDARATFLPIHLTEPPPKSPFLSYYYRSRLLRKRAKEEKEAESTVKSTGLSPKLKVVIIVLSSLAVLWALLLLVLLVVMRCRKNDQHSPRPAPILKSSTYPDSRKSSNTLKKSVSLSAHRLLHEYTPGSSKSSKSSSKSPSHHGSDESPIEGEVPNRADGKLSSSKSMLSLSAMPVDGGYSPIHNYNSVHGPAMPKSNGHRPDMPPTLNDTRRPTNASVTSNKSDVSYRTERSRKSHKTSRSHSKSHRSRSGSHLHRKSHHSHHHHHRPGSRSSHHRSGSQASRSRKSFGTSNVSTSDDSSDMYNRKNKKDKKQKKKNKNENDTSLMPNFEELYGKAALASLERDRQQSSIVGQRHTTDWSRSKGPSGDGDEGGQRHFSGSTIHPHGRPLTDGRRRSSVGTIPPLSVDAGTDKGITTHSPTGSKGGVAGSKSHAGGSYKSGPQEKALEHTRQKPHLKKEDAASTQGYIPLPPAPRGSFPPPPPLSQPSPAAQGTLSHEVQGQPSDIRGQVSQPHLPPAASQPPPPPVRRSSISQPPPPPVQGLTSDPLPPYPSSVRGSVVPPPSHLPPPVRTVGHLPSDKDTAQEEPASSLANTLARFFQRGSQAIFSGLRSDESPKEEAQADEGQAEHKQPGLTEKDQQPDIAHGQTEPPSTTRGQVEPLGITQGESQQPSITIEGRRSSITLDKPSLGKDGRRPSIMPDEPRRRKVAEEGRRSSIPRDEPRRRSLAEESRRSSITTDGPRRRSLEGRRPSIAPDEAEKLGEPSGTQGELKRRKSRAHRGKGDSSSPSKGEKGGSPRNLRPDGRKDSGSPRRPSMRPRPDASKEKKGVSPSRSKIKGKARESISPGKKKDEGFFSKLKKGDKSDPSKEKGKGKPGKDASKSPQRKDGKGAPTSPSRRGTLKGEKSDPRRQKGKEGAASPSPTRQSRRPPPSRQGTLDTPGVSPSPSTKSFQDGKPTPGKRGGEKLGHRGREGVTASPSRQSTVSFMGVPASPGSREQPGRGGVSASPSRQSTVSFVGVPASPSRQSTASWKGVPASPSRQSAVSGKGGKAKWGGEKPGRRGREGVSPSPSQYSEISGRDGKAREKPGHRGREGVSPSPSQYSAISGGDGKAREKPGHRGREGVSPSPSQHSAISGGDGKAREKPGREGISLSPSQHSAIPGKDGKAREKPGYRRRESVSPSPSRHASKSEKPPPPGRHASKSGKPPSPSRHASKSEKPPPPGRHASKSGKPPSPSRRASRSEKLPPLSRHASKSEKPPPPSRHASRSEKSPSPSRHASKSGKSPSPSRHASKSGKGSPSNRGERPGQRGKGGVPSSPSRHSSTRYGKGPPKTQHIMRRSPSSSRNRPALPRISERGISSPRSSRRGSWGQEDGIMAELASQLQQERRESRLMTMMARDNLHQGLREGTQGISAGPSGQQRSDEATERRLRGRSSDRVLPSSRQPSGVDDTVGGARRKLPPHLRPGMRRIPSGQRRGDEARLKAISSTSSTGHYAQASSRQPSSVDNTIRHTLPPPSHYQRLQARGERPHGSDDATRRSPRGMSSTSSMRDHVQPLSRQLSAADNTLRHTLPPPSAFLSSPITVGSQLPINFRQPLPPSNIRPKWSGTYMKAAEEQSRP